MNTDFIGLVITLSFRRTNGRRNLAYPSGKFQITNNKRGDVAIIMFVALGHASILQLYESFQDDIEV